jgi:hypothetical protein
MKEWALKHPILTFFLALLILLVVEEEFCNTYKLIAALNGIKVTNDKAN